MQIKTIEYSRVFNLGGYENKKVGVICEVGEETTEQAMEQAIKFVEDQSPQALSRSKEELDKKELEKAVYVVSNSEDHPTEEVLKACRVIGEHANDDLPF